MVVDQFSDLEGKTEKCWDWGGDGGGGRDGGEKSRWLGRLG